MVLSDTVLIAGLVTAGVTALGTTLTVMGGLYFITAYKQEQLNARESLRNERALAKLQFGGDNGGEGQNDLMSMAVPLLAGLMQNKQQPQQAAPTQQEMK